MTLIDIFWTGSIGAAGVMILIATLVFFRQEGRARLYMSGVLFSFVVLAIVSLLTAVSAGEAISSAAFKISRALAWSLVALMSLLWLLYQLNVINGISRRSDS